MNELPDDLLECLICWPKGTVGCEQERQLLTTLNALCKRFGYGRVYQLVDQINQLWYDPSKADGFRKASDGHNRLLEEYRKELQGEK